MKAAYIHLFFMLICLFSHGSKGHEGRPVFVQINALAAPITGQARFQLQWKIPPVLASGDEPTISLIAGSCKLTKIPYQQPLIGKHHYLCRQPPAKLAIKIHYPKSNPALSSLIIYEDIDGNNQHFFSGPEKIIIPISEDLVAYNIAKQYIWGGIKHILLGMDHLLFILCLIVLATTIPRILLTITGFTLAHTVTLVLTTLNWVSVSAPFIEILIPLSIVILAAEIIKGKKHPSYHSLTWRYPVVAASLLGLLHGFGFASVLSELGLPHDMKITALLFFNLGIEFGQICFIALVLSLSFLLSRLIGTKAQQEKMITALIYLSGGVASYWMLENFLSML